VLLTVTLVERLKATSLHPFLGNLQGLEDACHRSLEVAVCMGVGAKPMALYELVRECQIVRIQGIEILSQLMSRTKIRPEMELLVGLGGSFPTLPDH
jgi:hypothetical protein